MLDPYIGDLVEFFIDVRVENPRLEDNSFISYDIKIETNNHSFSARKSTVRRRYSEFVVLHKILSKEFPALKTPTLPPKFPFSNHFDQKFIEKRRGGLEDFLMKLVSQKIYLSSKAFHLFLQSNIPVSQIKDIIKGKDVPDELYDNSYLNNSHAKVDENINSVPAVVSSSTASPSVSAKCDNSPAGSKKVSFCDEVTVAQIHLE